MFSPEFETYEQSQAAGWQRINPDTTVAHHIKCRDVTNFQRDGVDFGGRLAIVGPTGDQLAVSSELFIGGKYAQYFRVEEVEQAIVVAKGLVLVAGSTPNPVGE